MRTPKRLYAEERIIYHPELLTCLYCGDLLVTWNYLAWDKTVQTLDRLLSIASRPGRCPHATCPGSRIRLLSAEAQRLAPPGSTYGYDVLVRIGWLRQHQHATYREIYTDLSAKLSISAGFDQGACGVSSNTGCDIHCVLAPRALINSFMPQEAS